MEAIENGSRQLRDGVMVTHLRSSDGASAIVADHGAHLLSWCPAGAAEALFMSSTSAFGGNAAIRGGVPIIFPQFGALGSGRRHGFARNLGWQYRGAALEDGAAVASWVLESPRRDADSDPGAGETVDSSKPGNASNAGNAGSDLDTIGAADAAGISGFRLTCDLRLAGDSIDIGLTIANTSQQVWGCQAALHSYLRVDALETTRVDGLEKAPYLDQTRPASDGTTLATTARQRDAAALVFAAEVDRIYPAAPGPVLLQDGQRRVEVRMQGFADLVAWNPGRAKALALADLHADGYREFVCIEAAAIIASIELAAGTHWRGVQSLRVLGN